MTGFPESFYGLDMRYVGNSPVPIPLVIFLVLAVIFGLVLHKTSFGRMGMPWNQSGGRPFFRELRWTASKIVCFMLSGLMPLWVPSDEHLVWPVHATIWQTVGNWTSSLRWCWEEPILMAGRAASWYRAGVVPDRVLRSGMACEHQNRVPIGRDRLSAHHVDLIPNIVRASETNVIDVTENWRTTT